MARPDPIVFTRDVAQEHAQRCGNRVLIEDDQARAITPANPLPVGAITAGQAGDTLVHEPGANIAATLTMAAPGAGQYNVISGIYWSLSGNPVAAVRMYVMEGGAPLQHAWHITVGGPGFMPFDPPRRFAANTAVTVHVAAAGVGIFGILSLHGWTE